MITSLYRYPVKGLSPEALGEARLIAQEGIMGDRAIAVARKPGYFDPKAPMAQPKHKFLMLMRDEALAALDTVYDDKAGLLRICHAGAQVAAGSVNTAQGRAQLETFFSHYLDERGLAPQVVAAPGHKFTDISVVSPEKMRAISLVNEASIDALNDAESRTFHPLRFRANIYFSGVPAWAENDWVGQDIMIGNARAKVVMRTKRCAATQVNPETAERDANVPALINKHFGHFDMGVYAEVLTDAVVKPGDRVRLLA